MSPPGGGVDPGSQVCGTKRLEEEESVRVSVSCEWSVRTVLVLEDDVFGAAHFSWNCGRELKTMSIIAKLTITSEYWFCHTWNLASVALQRESI